MYTRIKNLNGTSDNHPPKGYASFEEFWTISKGFWPYTCSVYGCSNRPEVGAHVKKVNSYDGSWYIVPMCKYHNNQRGTELDVDDGRLVKLNP